MGQTIPDVRYLQRHKSIFNAIYFSKQGKEISNLYYLFTFMLQMSEKEVDETDEREAPIIIILIMRRQRKEVVSTCTESICFV